MSSLSRTAPRTEDEENTSGGPIGALLIAIPVSVALWAIAFVLLLNLVH